MCLGALPNFLEAHAVAATAVKLVGHDVVAARLEALVRPTCYSFPVHDLRGPFVAERCPQQEELLISPALQVHMLIARPLWLGVHGRLRRIPHQQAHAVHLPDWQDRLQRQVRRLPARLRFAGAQGRQAHPQPPGVLNLYTSASIYSLAGVVSSADF